jgi:aminopeptidase N
MMDTWTKQMGYPVVTISSNGNTVTITQDRFLQYPLGNGTMASSPYNYIWTIPFDYITQNSPDNVVKQILSSVQGTIQWRVSTDGFIKANVKQNGFYRVNYDTDNWQKIIDHLMIPPQTRPQILSAVDRAGLLEDAFALSSAGLLNITYAFEMSRYLKTENHYIPWITGIRWFDKIANQLSFTGLYGKYKRYILSLLTNVIDNHSFNATNLTHLDTLLQAKVLLAGDKYGDDSIAEVGLQMFRKWMKNSSYVIPPNLHQIVYDVAIASGGETEWNFLFKWYLTTNNPYEKRLCLSALAKSTQPWILNQYLEYSLLPRYIKSQDTLTVISHVSANYQGRYLAWNFFREHWDELFKTFGGGSFNFARAIRTLTESFATQWELQEVETFFTEHPNAGSADLAVKQSIEIVRGNIKWLAANQATLDNWLSNQ